MALGHKKIFIYIRIQGGFFPANINFLFVHNFWNYSFGENVYTGDGKC